MKTHIYFLLDRTGSMASMAGDVIGGFNRFLAAQRADGDDARMTLVQFDSQDPLEILTDGVRISRVRDLTPATFQPRGGTPLLDATGALIRHASRRVVRRRAASKADESILFVTFTDGLENASHRFTHAEIRERVAGKEAEGWTFVYLGAALDAYADAQAIGYGMRRMQAFAPDAAGAHLAFDSLADETLAYRAAARLGAAPASWGFFHDKPAEADRRRRRPR